MIDRQDPGSERRLTLEADKGYDTSDFVADLRQKCVTPHVAAKIKGSAIDSRTTRHEGYKVSQRKRKLVEEAFGWGKTIAGLAPVKVRASQACASSSPSRWLPIIADSGVSGRSTEWTATARHADLNRQKPSAESPT